MFNLLTDGGQEEDLGMLNCGTPEDGHRPTESSAYRTAPDACALPETFCGEAHEHRCRLPK